MSVEIIAAIISSSVLAAILTSLSSFQLNKINYRYEYHKKILERRLVANEAAYSLVRGMSLLIQVDQAVIHNILLDEQSYNQFSINIAKALDHSQWLSTQTSHKLTELSVFLINNVSNQLPPDQKQRNERLFNELGEKYFNTIKEYKNAVNQSITDDLRRLYDIKSFLKQVRVDSTYPIFGNNYTETSNQG